MTAMTTSIIARICSSCGCTPEEAKEYLDGEIRNLLDYRDTDDLRAEDFAQACDSLGLEHDFIPYFIERLSMC